MLSEILPAREIKKRFPDAKEYKIEGRRQLPKFQEEQNPRLHALGLHQWDRLVEWGPPSLEPFAVAEYARTGKPGVVKFISNTIGQPLIRDIIYQHFTVDRNGEEMTVAEIVVAHLYPGELHLGDIEFSDPDKPLPPEKQKPYQGYEGLGLLKHTMPRLVQEARNLECSAVTLTAADPDLVGMFEKYGFTIADTMIGRMCRQTGMGGFPMELRLPN